MRSSIMPLSGKYYGTEIRIEEGKAKGRTIKLWFATGEPSDRELETWGLTRNEWDSDIIVDDGFGGKAPVRSMDYMCDSHYECQETYRVAVAVVEALKSL